MGKKLHFRIQPFIFFGILVVGLNISAQEIIQPSLDVDLYDSTGSESPTTDIPNSSQNNKPSNFIGAELYANYDNKGFTTVYLKRYLDCKTEAIPKNELVLVFETEIGSLFKSLSLEIIDSSKIDDGSATACSSYLEINNCMTVVTYSANLDLMIMPSGYDVVWKHGALSDVQFGLGPEDIPGLALTIHIPDPYQAKVNKLKGLGNIEKYVYCSGRSYDLNFNTESQYNGNNSYALFEPFSYHPKNSSEQDIAMFATTMTEELPQSNLPKEILLNGPPFIPIIKFQATALEFSETHNEAIQLNKNSGILNFTPPVTGRYLIGISKINIKTDTPLNYHQAVFLFDVK